MKTTTIETEAREITLGSFALILEGRRLEFHDAELFIQKAKSVVIPEEPAELVVARQLHQKASVTATTGAENKDFLSGQMQHRLQQAITVVHEVGKIWLVFDCITGILRNDPDNTIQIEFKIGAIAFL